MVFRNEVTIGVAFGGRLSLKKGESRIPFHATHTELTDGPVPDPPVLDRLPPPHAGVRLSADPLEARDCPAALFARATITPGLGNLVSINPQPLPPGRTAAINPQPLPPGLVWVG